MAKGAEIIVDYLVQEGVPYLFGVCGHGIIGFLDAAFDRRDDIKTITTHDERVAGFMADAYYRVAGEPAATYTSCGPGSLNLAMALANAFMDSSAVFAITGNVPTQQFNKGPFQETGRYYQGDFPSVIRNYVKRSYQAARPEMIPLIMRQAYTLMLAGRPGPVNVDVPLNVFVEETDEATPNPDQWRGGLSTRGAADPAAVRKAAAMLVTAQRPVILAGGGVHVGGAQKPLADFVERFQIPVITTPLGKGVIDERHRLSLGPTGRNGTYAANAAARNADVLVALGTRFDDRPTSAWIPGMTFEIPPTRLIHVDVDPAELGRNYPAEVGVVADAGLFLAQLAEALEAEADGLKNGHQQWLDLIVRWKGDWDAFMHSRATDDSEPLKPDHVVAEIGRVLPSDSIVMADVGVHHNWLLQQLHFPPEGRFLQAWGFASMGFAVAGSLGAKFAAPDRPVVAVAGDGCFLMHSNAVATAVEYGLGIVWVVWNNRGYGSIAGQQAGFFGQDREIGTRFRNMQTGELSSVDMVGLARSMGADSLRVDLPGEVAPAVEAALASGRPTVIDVRVDEIPQPSTGSWDLPPKPAPLPSFGWDGERNEGIEREEIRKLYEGQ